MRRQMAAILSAVAVLSLAGCGGRQDGGQATSAGVAAMAVRTGDGGTGTQPAGQTTGQSTGQTGGGAGAGEGTGSDEGGAGGGGASGGILVAYFSVMETDGVDTVAGASRVAVDGEALGNCQYIARLIHQSVGGDLFAIETVQEYPGTHEPLLDFAWDEKAQNARPQLATYIDNLEDYDTIFLGYPNWNADLPMPLYSFLEEYDFSGKTIIPFSTHGGSGFSRTVSTIAELEPGAEVSRDGLSISRNSVSEAADSVAQWVQGLDL